MMLSGWTAADYMMHSKAQHKQDQVYISLIFHYNHMFFLRFLSDLALDENKIAC